MNKLIIVSVLLILVSCQSGYKGYKYSDDYYRSGIDSILPDDQRMEYIMPAPSGMPLQLGVFKTKRWPKDKVIRVIWADGDADIQALTLSDWKAGIVDKVRASGNAAFDITTTTDPAQADMRVSFTPNNQAWSNVGTDCGYVAKSGGITMNLGWHIRYRTNAGNERFGTGCHEMMHALGYIHMLQDPACAGILIWNKDKVYADYARLGWSKEMVDGNVFAQYSANDIEYNGCDFNSIMCYEIPAGEANVTNHRNSYFTDLDNKKLLSDYGGNIAPPPPPPPPPPVQTTDIALGKSVMMSSTTQTNPPGNATDGNINTWCLSQPENSPWIYVDLGAVTPISGIKIFSRKDCCMGFMRNIRVWCTNTVPGIGYDDPGSIFAYSGYLQPGQAISISKSTSCRYVRVQFKGVGENVNIIQIASLEVYGTGGGGGVVCKDTIYKVKHAVVTWSEVDSLGRVCR